MIIPLHSPIAHEAWSLKLGGATSMPHSQGRGSADLESLHPVGLELGTSASIPNAMVWQTWPEGSNQIRWWMPLWHLPTRLKERGDLHPNPFGLSQLAPVSTCNLLLQWSYPYSAQHCHDRPNIVTTTTYAGLTWGYYGQGLCLLKVRLNWGMIQTARGIFACMIVINHWCLGRGPILAQATTISALHLARATWTPVTIPCIRNWTPFSFLVKGLFFPNGPFSLINVKSFLLLA